MGRGLDVIKDYCRQVKVGRGLVVIGESGAWLRKDYCRVGESGAWLRRL